MTTVKFSNVLKRFEVEEGAEVSAIIAAYNQARLPSRYYGTAIVLTETRGTVWKVEVRQGKVNSKLANVLTESEVKVWKGEEVQP